MKEICPVQMFCEDYRELEACLSDASVMWPIIRFGCNELLDSTDDELCCMLLTSTDLEEHIEVKLTVETALVTLTRELRFREEREEYEECAEIAAMMAAFRKKWPERAQNLIS